MILCLWLGGKITYSYVDILFCTSWLITEEQIKIYRGVFSKSINYIELYRVYDYSEEQSFIQSLTHNTTVIIFSGDRSTPKLVIAGIEANTEIINIIRKRVELQKKSNLVYEVTNNKY